MNLKAIIIDDEVKAIENLELLLKQYCRGVEVLATANGVVEGLKTIRSHQADIIFLDVEMHDGTGFDLLELITPTPSCVIFTTAHDAYAIDAFRVNALDYLLKPIDPDELSLAIKKAKERTDNQQKKIPGKLAIKTQKNLHIIDIEKIVRCESDGNYTHLHLIDGSSLMIAKTIKEYENKLSGHYFYRIHQSHLINMKYVDRIEKREGYEVVLKDETTLPIATRKKDGFFDYLSELV